MRLYLSSFRLGRYTDRLVGMAAGPRVALVPNALDGLPDSAREAGLTRDLADFAAAGLPVTVVDLRDADAFDLLSRSDIVWIRGGNVFVLRRVMAETGADAFVTALLHDDAVCYGGYSAGACVLCPDLDRLRAVDDISVVPEPITTGLSVVDRLIVPHVDSPDHPENEACTGLAEALSAEGQPHWALRDGDVLVVQGRSPELLH